MYQAKDGKKYGSAFVGKRKDAEHDKSEEKFSSYQGEEQPEVDAEPEHHGEDKANLEGKDKHEHSDSSEDVHDDSPSEVVEHHGPAESIHYEHSHEKGEHKVTSFHPEDGHEHQSVHSTAAEAYEQGGALSFTDVKRREHPDQALSEPENKNYEAPETA